MSKLVLKYVDVLLVILAMIFLVFLAAYFLWGISDLAANLNKAINDVKSKEKSPSSIRFNFDEAEKLNLRNLTQ